MSQYQYEMLYPCNSAAEVHHFEAEVSPDPYTPTSFALKGTSIGSKGSGRNLPTAVKQWVRIRPDGGKNVTGPDSDPICRVVP